MHADDAVRRERQLRRRREDADHACVQPLREETGAEDAEGPIWIHPHREQRLHALADVRHWRQCPPHHHQPGQQIHCRQALCQAGKEY